MILEQQTLDDDSTQKTEHLLSIGNLVKSNCHRELLEREERGQV